MLKKIFSFLAITGIALGAGATVPVVPQETKWVVSYETIMFDTADGDLGEDEYAVALDEGWYVRTVPKDEGQFENTTNEKDIEGKKLVGIRAQKTPENQSCTGCAYYSEFRDKYGKVTRVQQEKKEYEDLKTKKGAPQPKRNELVPLFDPILAEAAIGYSATTTTGRVANSTGQSFSHNITGSDTILYVFPGLNDVTGTDRDVTAATYNGDALTLYDSRASATIETHILYRIAPDAGNNTVSLTYGGTNSSANTSAISFNGARQTSATPVTTSGTFTAGYDIYSPVAGSYAVGIAAANTNSGNCNPTGSGVQQIKSESGAGALSEYVLTLENLSADTEGTIDWDCTSASNTHTFALLVYPSCDPSTEECTDTFMYYEDDGGSTATTSVTNIWTAPTGVSAAVGACWGSGGGGGAISTNGGGGGGGGAYASSNLTVSAGTSYPVVTGGIVGSEGSERDSYFGDGSVLIADGGASGSDATGGAGGATADSIGDIAEFAGGNGGNGETTGDTSGGGGGSAGPSGAGGNGNVGTGTIGGDGGTGNNGATSGGGGGNATQGARGGNSILGGAGGGGADDGIACNTGSFCAGGYVGGGAGGGETGGGAGGIGMCRITYGSAGGGSPASSPAHFYFKNSDVRVKDADVRFKR